MFRTIARVGTGIAAAVLVGALTAPGFADSTTTYSGTFGGQISYQGCTTDPGTHVAGGTWRVSVHGDGDATARFVITVDGAPHVAFTAPMQADRLRGNEVFADTLTTGAGPLRVSLRGDQFTYRISPYDYSQWGGLVCDAVTYYGTLTP